MSVQREGSRRSGAYIASGREWEGDQLSQPDASTNMAEIRQRSRGALRQRRKRLGLFVIAPRRLDIEDVAAEARVEFDFVKRDRDVLVEPTGRVFLGREDLDGQAFQRSVLRDPEIDPVVASGRRSIRARREADMVGLGGGLAFPSSVNRDIENSEFLPADEWYTFGTRFTGSVAAGTSFHVSDKLSIRLDGVMNLWKITTPVGWLTTDADPLGENPQGEWVSAKSITLGASWRH